MAVATIELCDGTDLSIMFVSSGQIVVGYGSSTLQDAVFRGLESYHSRGLPELNTFLGIKLGSEFMDILESLSKPQQNGNVVNVSFTPKKPFADFKEYCLEFSRDNGVISTVYCWKACPNNEDSRRWMDVLMTQIEHKYSRKFHLTPYAGIKGKGRCWEMHFYSDVLHKDGRWTGESKWTGVVYLLVEPNLLNPSQLLVKLAGSDPEALERCRETGESKSIVNTIDAL